MWINGVWCANGNGGGGGAGGPYPDQMFTTSNTAYPVYQNSQSWSPPTVEWVAASPVLALPPDDPIAWLRGRVAEITDLLVA